jgi:hypothetical protein
MAGRSQVNGRSIRAGPRTRAGLWLPGVEVQAQNEVDHGTASEAAVDTSGGQHDEHASRVSRMALQGGLRQALVAAGLKVLVVSMASQETPVLPKEPATVQHLDRLHSVGNITDLGRPRP